MNRNVKAKIKANYRDTQNRKARMASKKSHSAKVLEMNLFMAIFGAMAGFFKGVGKAIRVFFGRPQRIRSWCVKHPYVYNGKPGVKGANGKRYDVFMRENGRKYKMARS